jgi:FkbM family methyltransferase
MLIFDIGANVGNYAKAWASKGHTVVSVEASPSTYARLTQAVGSLPNILTVHRAVCDALTPTVTFYESTCDTLSTLNKWWLSSSESRFGSHYYKSECTVPTITLDTLMKQYGIPDMIKIDVEGAEDSVIRSLSTKVNRVCIEWAAESSVVTMNSLDSLSKLGYTAYHIQHQDDYTYIPGSFELTLDECKHRIQSMRPKVDWGMIWVSA